MRSILLRASLLGAPILFAASAHAQEAYPAAQPAFVAPVPVYNQGVVAPAVAPVYPQPVYQPIIPPAGTQPVYAPAPAPVPMAAYEQPARDQDGFFFKPYVGADFSASTFTDTPSGVEDNYTGGDIHVGARLHRNFGVEAGYFVTDKGSDSSSGTTVESEFKGANLDLMGYAPITEDFELIGSVGASYTEGKISVAGVGSAEGSDWDARYGAGAQYWLTDNVNARAMVHYTDDPDGSDIVTGTVGLNLQF